VVTVTAVTVPVPAGNHQMMTNVPVVAADVKTVQETGTNA
jgi:hypothetical protein